MCRPRLLSRLLFRYTQCAREETIFIQVTDKGKVEREGGSHVYWQEQNMNKLREEGTDLENDGNCNNCPTELRM